jgi:LCP family protein required for cell wall assembly
MSQNQTDNVSRRNYMQYVLAFLVVIALLVFGGLLIRKLPDFQEQSDRQYAYAATATQLARPTRVLPPTTVPTPIMVNTPSPPPLIPTEQDFTILPTPEPVNTLPPGVPPRATLFPQHNTYELINFLLLGSDRRDAARAYRTDVIIIASVNWRTQTVNLLSIPRDLYVYIPGWGMERINSAELFQTQLEYTGHRLGLLAETIEYNLGIRIDHLARIDFDNFENLIDVLGGVDIPVDCPVRGFQPGAEGSGEWIPFTLEPGLRRMTGAEALWYVRQRTESSDFDRNRRQQILLRSIWHRAVQTDLVANLPALWNQLIEMIETDVTLDQALGYIPIVVNLNSAKIESHYLGLDEVDLWRTPSGANVLVLDQQPFEATIVKFLTPPVENQLVQEGATVTVLNGSSLAQADHLAAAQLQWAGVVAVPGGTSPVQSAETVLYDHTGRIKGSSLSIIQETLGIPAANVSIVQDASRTSDFAVVLGEDYEPCNTSPWTAFPQPD